ncbi:MAG: aspartate kinase [Cytophagales bacterium]
MKILKFGQSTLQDTSSIALVLDIIVKNPKSVVVVSPLYKVSTRLGKIGNLAMVGDNSYKPILQDIEDEHFAIAKHFVDIKHQAKVIAGLKVMLNDLEEILYGVYLLWELSPRTKDHIATYGVKLSAYLMAECLKSKGADAHFYETQNVIITNDVYGQAEVYADISLANIRDKFAKNEGISVITGSVGSTEKGESSNMGKSGSSYTSALFANALNAASIEIYTDRDGILNTDPTLVDNAFSLKEISYAEVMEMSNFGNSFVYPPAIQPAIVKNIPITIKNLYNVGFEGTVITNSNHNHHHVVKANSSVQNVSLINVQGSGMIGVAGVASRVFGTLAHENISVVLITQASSEHSICLAVKPENGTKAQLALQKEFMEEIREKKMDNISLTKELSIIAIIGENMKQTPGIAGKIFQALGENQINVVAIAQGSSEFNISVVVEMKVLAKTLNVLHKSLFGLK